MAALSAKLRSVEASDGFKRIAYFCPGCKRCHVIPVEGPRAWQWNGDVDSPTLSPSVRSQVDWPTGIEICHHFLVDGIIEFCGDTTHALRGKAAHLPDFPVSDAA